MVEFKKLIQPIAVQPIDLLDGKVEILNKFDSQHLEAIRLCLGISCRWRSSTKWIFANLGYITR